MKEYQTDMLTDIRNLLIANLRRVYRSTIALLPTVSADERTRSSWAKSIESYEAVPEAYKGFFEPFLVENGDTPTADDGRA